MIKNLIFETVPKITGNSFNKEYQTLSNIQDKESLNQFQKSNIKKLLLFTNKNVEYYKDVYRNQEITDKLKEESTFEQIPLLTKDIITENFKGLTSNDIKFRKWYYNYSGGSTGKPLKFIQDNIYVKWRNATNYYYYSKLLNIEEPTIKKVILWGSEKDLFYGRLPIKDKLINWLTNTVLLNSFRMKEKDMEIYIKKINSYKPDLIRGYAGSLYELCRYAEKRNLDIHQPKVIVSAAETLRTEMREKIESVFGTKVYNFYGSREVSSIAGECEFGSMHIFSFWNYLEILKNGNPVKNGCEGKVILTNLFNYAMPFIRYNIGDTAILGGNCKCSNPLPVIKKLNGRIIDHFILKNGTVVPAEFFIHLIGVVCNKGYIDQFQVIQEDYSSIKILVSLKTELSISERNAIENKIRLVMGNDCVILWEFVDHIPKTKSGKYIYTQSKLV